MGFGVADKGGDVVVGEKSVREDFGLREAIAAQVKVSQRTSSLKQHLELHTGGSQSLGMRSQFARGVLR